MARKLPYERFRDRLVMPLEGKKTLADRCQGREVVGREDLPLHDGEVDLDLIEPTGVDGTVNRDDAGIFLHEAFHAGGAAMGGAVVHDPEHAPGLVVGRLSHDLIHEPMKRIDPGLSFAPAEELGPKNVEGRKVRPCAAPAVFVFDPHRLPGFRRNGRMPPGASLDGGLLVGGQNELVVLEWFSLEDPLVEVKDPARLGGEERIARKNPAPMLPGLDRILGKPAPDRAVADPGHQPGASDLRRHVGRAHPGERHPQVGGQLTRQGLDVDDEFRGERPAGGRGGSAPQALPGVARRTASAISRRSPGEYPGGSRSHRWTNPRPPRGSSWPGRHNNTVTNTSPHAASARFSLPGRGRSGMGLVSAWTRPSLATTMPHLDANGKS